MSSAPLRRSTSWVARLGGAALVVGSLAAGATTPAGAATKPPVLTSISVNGFPDILADSTGTLYVLSTEHAGVLHCKGACLATWRPVEVPSSTKTVKVSSKAKVRGKVGFVKRTSTEKQVTYNGYPLYTYAADKNAVQVKGASLAADGGRWYLVHAAGTTNATTSFQAQLQAANITGFSGVLEANTSLTYYVLSDEVGGTLHCTGQCLSSWPPLLVGSATTAAEVSLGAGVDGKIGFVTRSATQKQVTFNSYPVYTFSGDTGPNQSNGQGITEPGGATWHLVDASATTASSTSVTS
jgi:predicted lipoprotein with Yx(FWY)xxD motif